MGWQIYDGCSPIAGDSLKVAVTGATGFVGRAVMIECARRAIKTIAVVRSPKIGSMATEGMDVVPLDLYDRPVDTLRLLGRPDILIHLAWGGLPNYKSLHHIERELPAHYDFLKGLIEAGLPSLVVAGTCFEYGMQTGSLSEDLPTHPSNPYGFAKDTLRRQLESLKDTHRFALTWARFFYLYGEGQSETALLPQLKKAVKGGDKLFNMSGGEQVRDYLPVSEAARCLVSLALANKDIGVVNVCSGKPVSIRSLVEGWIRENGWSIGLNLGYWPYPDYEPMAFWGVRHKLDSVIGAQ